ncbi:hypothetical protein BLAT2472_10727 [Burkholderia latens]
MVHDFSPSLAGVRRFLGCVMGSPKVKSIRTMYASFCLQMARSLRTNRTDVLGSNVSAPSVQSIAHESET